MVQEPVVHRGNLRFGAVTLTLGWPPNQRGSCVKRILQISPRFSYPGALLQCDRGDCPAGEPWVLLESPAAGQLRGLNPHMTGGAAALVSGLLDELAGVRVGTKHLQRTAGNPVRDPRSVN